MKTRLVQSLQDALTLPSTASTPNARRCSARSHRPERSSRAPPRTARAPTAAEAAASTTRHAPHRGPQPCPCQSQPPPAPLPRALPTRDRSRGRVAVVEWSVVSGRGPPPLGRTLDPDIRPGTDPDLPITPWGPDDNVHILPNAHQSLPHRHFIIQTLSVLCSTTASCLDTAKYGRS